MELHRSDPRAIRRYRLPLNHIHRAKQFAIRLRKPKHPTRCVRVLDDGRSTGMLCRRLKRRTGRDRRRRLARSDLACAKFSLEAGLNYLVRSHFGRHLRTIPDADSVEKSAAPVERPHSRALPIDGDTRAGLPVEIEVLAGTQSHCFRPVRAAE